jgi:hypothetical protein
MKPPPLLGINGRLRQHITKVGAAYANRISSPNSRKAVTNDDFVKELLESGKITEKQLQQAIDGYNYFGGTFAWMQDVKDRILDRADNVFLAKYGRDAIEDSDFRVNGDYYKICKNLERNWHQYDADLEKLRWDFEGKLISRTDTGEQTSSPSFEKSNLKKNPGSRFGLTFFVLAGFIVFAVVAKFIPPNNVGIFFGVAGAWLASAFIYSAMFPLWRCGRCGKGYYKETSSRCKRCGAKL